MTDTSDDTPPGLDEDSTSSKANGAPPSGGDDAPGEIIDTEIIDNEIIDNDGGGDGGGDDARSAGATPPGSDISPITLEEEMRTSYLDYAMSVIVSRALPDVCDGLKPVHRRILFSMHESGYDYNKPYRKSARVVGDVIGKYHPHGDQSIYDALVRLAQAFSMRLPLLDGQGNFGSVDGDSPAAMRYTEVRMAKAAHALLEDIDRDVIDFQDNYDNSEREPKVLPARFPNLLVNGGAGIAVGMATNIPPHNLHEIVSGTIALIDNPLLSDEDLLGIIPGPDFPTGGYIMGVSGSQSAVLTGRGSIIMRARSTIETIRKDREAIVVTEIPYQTNKAVMIARIAELVRDKQIEGVSDLRDESDRDGMRIVIELKRDAMADVVLNQIYKFSQLQTSFSANMVALRHGRPSLMNVRQMLETFILFREDVVTRRCKFLLNKARDRAHVLVGLAIAIANIDEVITLIRGATSPTEARENLMMRDWPAHDVADLIGLIDDLRHTVAEDGTYRLSEAQARAILDIRLQRLTAIGRDEIGTELAELRTQITDLLDILQSRERLMALIRSELVSVRDEFATPRRSVFLDDEGDMDDESLIPSEEMVVTVSNAGYIKRVPLTTYRAQRRGGKGRAGMTTKEEDFVTRIFVANTHQPLLFFSTTGVAYMLKVWRLPLGSPTARGKAMVNILRLKPDETITTIMALPQDELTWQNMYIMFATRFGNVRRNDLSAFTKINRAGKIAMKPAEGDQIIGVEMCTEDDDVLLTSDNGKCIRFSVKDVRVFKSRDSSGVRGIRLVDGASVISMAILLHSDALPAERVAYLRQAAALRRMAGDDDVCTEVPGENGVPPEPEDDLEGDDNDGVDGVDGADATSAPITLTEAQFSAMQESEQFILTVSTNGYGKRSSSYGYRVTRRGGKGIIGMTINDRNGQLVSAFPVVHNDQLLLVTDSGQLIRCPVVDIRIATRNTQGVIVFRTNDDARVVSVVRSGETQYDDDIDGDGTGTDDASVPDDTASDEGGTT